MCRWRHQSTLGRAAQRSCLDAEPTKGVGGISWSGRLQAPFKWDSVRVQCSIWKTEEDAWAHCGDDAGASPQLARVDVGLQAALRHPGVQLHKRRPLAAPRQRLRSRAPHVTARESTACQSQMPPCRIAVLNTTRTAIGRQQQAVSGTLLTRN